MFLPPEIIRLRLSGFHYTYADAAVISAAKVMID